MGTKFHVLATMDILWTLEFVDFKLYSILLKWIHISLGFEIRGLAYHKIHKTKCPTNENYFTVLYISVWNLREIIKEKSEISGWHVDLSVSMSCLYWQKVQCDVTLHRQCEVIYNHVSKQKNSDSFI